MTRIRVRRHLNSYEFSAIRAERVFLTPLPEGVTEDIFVPEVELTEARAALRAALVRIDEQAGRLCVIKAKLADARRALGETSPLSKEMSELDEQRRKDLAQANDMISRFASEKEELREELKLKTAEVERLHAERDLAAKDSMRLRTAAHKAWCVLYDVTDG